MSRIVSKPLTKTFEIEDPEGNWTVSFRQMTEGDYIDIGDLTGKVENMYDDNGLFIGQRILRNNRRAERRAVWRTLSSCDLVYEDGTLIFESKGDLIRKDMTEAKFNERWDLLPQALADIIVEKFYDVNPPEGE